MTRYGNDDASAASALKPRDVDGAELAEDLIKRQFTERQRLRDKVTASFRRRKAASKATESGEKA